MIFSYFFLINHPAIGVSPWLWKPPYGYESQLCTSDIGWLIMFNQIFPLRIWHTKTQTHHEFHQSPYIFESLKDIVQTVSGYFSVSREYLLRDEKKSILGLRLFPQSRQLKAIWISPLSNHWYRIDTLQPDMTQWPLKGPFSSMADYPQPHPTNS
jgi:hypothetical protein